MRAILQDENSLETPLDRMESTYALTWIIILIISLLLAAISSFIPPNTLIFSRLSNRNYDIEGASISHRARFGPFNPLNGFLFLYISPNYETLKPENLTFTIKGNVRFLDNSSNVFRSKSLNETINMLCSPGYCPPITAFEANIIDFSSVVLYADIECNFPGLKSINFWSLSLDGNISIVGAISIIACIIPISLLLFTVIPFRFRPSTLDHWASLFLGLGLAIIDGPWILLKYYIPGYFSQFFDVVPDIFHAYFILFLTFFVESRTLELPHRIFKSNVIKISILILCALTISVQFFVTDSMPLSTMALHLRLDDDSRKPPNSLIYTMYAFTSIYIVSSFLIIIYGILSLQFKYLQVLILVSLTFIILQIIYTVRTILRIFVPYNQIGFAFATDIFYILMANIVTFFFLSSNIPNGFHIPNDREEAVEQVLEVIPPDDEE